MHDIPKHRYATDPKFAAQMDTQVELSTAHITSSDVSGRSISPGKILEIAFEFWLQGEVHLFEEEDGQICILPPKRVIEKDGKTFLLVEEEDIKWATVPILTLGDGRQGVFLNEHSYTRLTKDGDQPSVFVEALRTQWVQPN